MTRYLDNPQHFYFGKVPKFYLIIPFDDIFERFNRLIFSCEKPSINKDNFIYSFNSLARISMELFEGCLSIGTTNAVSILTGSEKYAGQEKFYKHRPASFLFVLVKQVNLM